MDISLRNLLGMSSPDGPVLDELGDAPERDPLDGSADFHLAMKKRRRAAIMQAMLRQQGMDDLAKMVAVREGAE